MTVVDKVNREREIYIMKAYGREKIISITDLKNFWDILHMKWNTYGIILRPEQHNIRMRQKIVSKYRPKEF